MTTAQTAWPEQPLVVRRADLHVLYEAGQALRYQARVLGGAQYGKQLGAVLERVAQQLGVPFDLGPQAE